jgi:hypothetical protein
MLPKRELKVHKKDIRYMGGGPGLRHSLCGIMNPCHHVEGGRIVNRDTDDWDKVTCLRCLDKRPKGIHLTREQMCLYLESDPEGCDLPGTKKANERKFKIHKTGEIGHGIVCRYDCAMPPERQSNFWGDVTCLRCLHLAPEGIRPERPKRPTIPSVTVRSCIPACHFGNITGLGEPTCNFPGTEVMIVLDAPFVTIPEKCPLIDGDLLVKYTLKERT